ncbi:hypothetical protein SOVF_203750, partial [Spinacia oleracea]
MGPVSDSQAKKTKSMDEILGVAAMEVETEDEANDSTEEEGEIHSPKTSLSVLKTRSEAHKTFSTWLSVMKSGKEPSLNRQVTPIPIFQDHDHEESASDIDSIVSIDLEDIQEEVDYWNSAIVCVVLGANPPLSVIEGFFRRIWKNLGVDKVVEIEHGVFIVRFFTMENRDKVINDIRPTFDKKPVICKPWHKDIDDFKDEVKVVPIWVQLKHLGLKFWGSKCLSKIVSSIGNFIQADKPTVQREKLRFARDQVEVTLTQELPECIKFHDEHGRLKTINIGYEWKPTVCDHCKLLGHVSDDCRKKKGKKKWVAK